MPRNRNRIGSCCGRGPKDEGEPIGGDLDNIPAVRKFIELIDNHATVKKYQIEFGWSMQKLQARLKEQRLYRRTLMAADKIKKVMDSAKDMESVRPEINRLRRLMWRDGPLDEV